MISQKLQDFDEEVKPIGEVLTQATIEIYQSVVARFLPTPAKIHYLFNLRDISRVSIVSSSCGQFIRPF
jgi:dynein heavy chain, axonemal